MPKKLIFIFLLLLPVFIFSDNNAVDFLETGLSARQLALGNTGVALPGHLDCIFFNPAGLSGQIESMEIISSAANNFEEVERKNIGWACRGDKFNWSDNTNYFGLNFSTSFVGNILNTEWQDDRPNVTGKFNSEQNNITITYTKELDPFWIYGFNIKRYSHQLDNYFGQAIGLDLGLLYRSPENFYDCPVVIGLAFHNLGRTTFSWSTGHSDTIPLRLNLGVTLYKNIFNNKFSASGEIEKTENEAAIFRFGSEYWLVQEIFAVRAGWDQEHITYGLGLQYKELGIDYAQTELEDLGFIRRITLRYSF